jgi:hypothetical protein
MKLEVGARMRKNQAPRNPQVKFVFQAHAVAAKKTTIANAGHRMPNQVTGRGHPL